MAAKGCPRGIYMIMIVSKNRRINKRKNRSSTHHMVEIDESDTQDQRTTRDLYQ